MVNNGHWPLGSTRQPRRRRRALGWAGGSPPAPGPGGAQAERGFPGVGGRRSAPRTTAPGPAALSGPASGPGPGAPGPAPPSPRLPPRRPARPRSHSGAPRPASPRRPRSPRWGPRRQPHLHARGPGVDPRVQDGDEHPSPVILRVAAQEGRGPGLLLREEAVEREGLLGRCGGHGRRLQGGREANGRAARGQAAARGQPGRPRAWVRRGGADGVGGASLRPIAEPSGRAGQSRAATSEPTAPLSGSRAREVPGAAEKGAEPGAWPEGFGGLEPSGRGALNQRDARGGDIFFRGRVGF